MQNKLFLSLASIALALICTSPARAAGNILSNGDFESGGYGAWEDEGGSSVAAADKWRGSYGVNFTTAPHPRVNQVFSTTPGTTYYVSAHIRINSEPTAPQWGGLRVQVVDSSFAQIGYANSLSSNNSPIGEWTRIDFSFEATSNQSRIQYENFSGGGVFDASADNFIVSDETIPADGADPGGGGTGGGGTPPAAIVMDWTQFPTATGGMFAGVGARLVPTDPLGVFALGLMLFPLVGMVITSAAHLILEYRVNRRSE